MMTWKIPCLWSAAGRLVILVVLASATVEKRCVCMMDKDTWFSSYDLLKLKLPLPCTYRMTRLRTRTGCDMRVNLVMSETGGKDSPRPAGMTYLVKEESGMASGVVSARGVGISDPQGFDTVFYPPSAMSMNGVEVYCYTDNLRFKSALFPSCSVSLHYQPNGYLGVYSRNTSYDFVFSREYLCGDCDGGKSEMRMLGSDITRRMRTWEDRTAAMLLYTSLHIVGGDNQCMAHADTVRRCPATTVLRANQICGCILSPHSQTGRCMRKRTSSRDRILTYYACVEQFCSFRGSANTGCNMVREMLRRNTCPPPGRFFC